MQNTKPTLPAAWPESTSWRANSWLGIKTGCRRRQMPAAREATLLSNRHHDVGFPAGAEKTLAIRNQGGQFATLAEMVRVVFGCQRAVAAVLWPFQGANGN